MNEFTTLRQQAGLTVEEAAELIGYTERTVFRWKPETPARAKPSWTLSAAARPSAN